MRLRSRSLKLIIAFLLVGLTGALPGALFVARYTCSALDLWTLDRRLLTGIRRATWLGAGSATVVALVFGVLWARSLNRTSAEQARANKLRRQMTADIAHDLRTPLSILLGYAEALDDGTLQGTPQVYGAMHRQAQHLRRLVDDLSTLSLADAGELPLNQALVAPLSLLERTAAAYQMRSEQREIGLRVDAAPDLPPVRVDPDRMAQVLGNLMDNALRYTPPGGQITLAARLVSDAIHLSVRDTGAGIAPEDLPYVFERFYQGYEARHPEDGASGLGLAIARSIVELHGGSISVESALNRGTTATIALPITG